jgi:tetratricopeptide (TPR) repeat protein
MLLLPLFLASCASQLPAPAADAAPAPQAQPEAVVADSTVATPAAEPVVETPAEPEEPKYGNFSEDVLSRAILAELAGQRGQTQQSLDEYLVLARETGDLNIIKRTMRIAVFLRNVQASLEMGNLWLEREPESIEARQTIAIQMIALGRYGEAVEQLVTLLEQGSQVNFRIISARMATDSNAGLYRDALIGDFQDLLQRFPTNESLKLSLAHLYQQNDQHAEAYVIVSELTEVNASPEVVMLEVQLLELLGEPERARTRLADSVEAHPGHKQLRFMYGRKLIEQRDFQEARKQFTILVEQNPSDYDIVYSLALLSMEVNQFDEARGYLDRLVSNGKRLDDAHYYLGFLNAQENNSTAAIEHYLRVTGGSNFLQTQRNLTELMIRADRYNEVKAHLQNVRFRNADYNIQLLTMEANVLMDEGRNEDASTLLNSSIGAFPNDINLLFLRSVLAQNLNDLALMEADLRKIIELDPSSPVAYNSLGYTLADRTDRYQEAYDLISRAAELAPNDPAIIDSLGWVQYRLGRYEEAQRNLARAYELFPDHEVAAHLGEVLWVMGEQAEATKVWRNALEVEPNSSHILNTIQRLNAGASL